MRQPPPYFVRALECLDPLLRVRWGSVLNKWVIDRKAPVPDEEIRFLVRRLSRLRLWSSDLNRSLEDRKRLWQMSCEIEEELDSAKDRRRVILFAYSLDTSLFESLCLGDIKRYGGYSRYAAELEARETRALAEAERKAKAQREDIHREVYDVLNWAWDKHSVELQAGEGSRLLREALGKEIEVMTHG